LLAPLLSIRAVRISRSVSKTLDRITWCVITALLFVFFGDAPAGVNAATVVLRNEQNEIDALYRQARDDAAAKIVARSIYVAIKADETLSRGARPIAVPQIGPARPPGSPRRLRKRAHVRLREEVRGRGTQMRTRRKSQ